MANDIFPKPPPDCATFGARVRHYREAMMMTQATLASYLGKHPTYISHVEGGRVGNPTLATLKKFAGVFGCQPGDLVGNA